MFYDQPRPASNEGWQTDVDNRIRYGLKKGIELGVLQKGATIIALQGWGGGSGTSFTWIASLRERAWNGLTISPFVFPPTIRQEQLFANLDGSKRRQGLRASPAGRLKSLR